MDRIEAAGGYIQRGTASMVKGAHRGTPQGGVLSPLLWNLVVDDLIKRL